MNKVLSGKKMVVAKYRARCVQSFHIGIPAGKIDLYKWITQMTDADYVSYSGSHQAMGSFRKDNVFYMKNVENIGIETIVQNYELVYHTPGHIQLYSSCSKAYLFRWFPVVVGVPWNIWLEPVSVTSCRMVCMIGTDYPSLILKMAAWVSGIGGLFLKRHLQKEGSAFARDIEIKFKD